MNSKTLNQIRRFSLIKYSLTKDKQHNLEHVKRVSRNAVKIVKRLGVSKDIDLNLLEAACYLHDIVVSKNRGTNFSMFISHIFEKPLNKKYIPQIIKQFNLPKNEAQILTDAIINHPGSIPYRRLNRKKDLYSKILQDADSLDYISTQRQISFIQTKGKILSFISKLFLFHIRKNIKFFLNFPELHTEFVKLPG